MSKAAYRATVNDTLEDHVEQESSEGGAEAKEESKKKLRVNRLLIISSSIFVSVALILISDSPRSTVGGTLLFVGILLGFGYASREVDSLSMSRRL
jgi:hypothetical protein